MRSKRSYKILKAAKRKALRPKERNQKMFKGVRGISQKNLRSKIILSKRLLSRSRKRTVPS
jgi:hypothetical protein